jgi:hypothetical protein
MCNGDDKHEIGDDKRRGDGKRPSITHTAIPAYEAGHSLSGKAASPHMPRGYSSGRMQHSYLVCKYYFITTVF